MTVTFLSNVKIGKIPPTPLVPINIELKNAYNSLMGVASFYGFPVGYAQEQNGVLIQNIMPNPKTEYSQISTSSKTTLDLHTETAFHKYLPDYVLLLCLRGDPTATTTYAELDDVLTDLHEDCIKALCQKWFRTSVDESFRTNGEPDSPVDLAVLYKDNGIVTRIKYDKSVMKGLFPEAQRALEFLNKAITKNTKEVILKTSDLMVINNATTVHGRKPFQARYDGTDRWVQRLLVRTDISNLPHVRLCPQTGHTVITEYK